MKSKRSYRKVSKSSQQYKNLFTYRIIMINFFTQQLWNANTVFCNGNTLLEIIGESVPMEMERWDVAIKKSSEHVPMLQSERAKHLPFPPSNRQPDDLPVPPTNGQLTYRMYTRMRSITNTTKWLLTKMPINRHKVRTSSAPSLQCSRFFSSYVQLLQSMFTSIMAIF